MGNKIDATFWRLAWQSRQLIWGAGLAALGAVLLAIIGFDSLTGSPYSDSARFLAKEAGALLLGGAVLFQSGVPQVRWWVRLSRHGQEANAIITKVTPSWMQPYAGRRVIYRNRLRIATYIVHYRYEDPFGCLAQRPERIPGQLGRAPVESRGLGADPLRYRSSGKESMGWCRLEAQALSWLFH